MMFRKFWIFVWLIASLANSANLYYWFTLEESESTNLATINIVLIATLIVWLFATHKKAND